MSIKSVSCYDKKNRPLYSVLPIPMDLSNQSKIQLLRWDQIMIWQHWKMCTSLIVITMSIETIFWEYRLRHSRRWLRLALKTVLCEINRIFLYNTKILFIYQWAHWLCQRTSSKSVHFDSCLFLQCETLYGALEHWQVSVPYFRLY